MISQIKNGKTVGPSSADFESGPVTKLGKSNKTTSKKFDYHVMLENCDVITIFSNYGQSGAFIIFFDSTKLKIVWIKITFFKRRVSIIL